MNVTRRQLLRLSGSATLLAALGGYGFARSKADNPRDVRIGELTWKASLPEAKSRAAQEQKPVLLLSLFGRLDHDFC
jgi:hypothetical protein